jgi:hypothetical protein
MFFLIRTAFWLSLVIMLLPADGETGDKAPRVTAFETISAAGATVSDLSQFCKRNPDVCVTGGSAFQVFADKVRYGAKLIYGYFGDKKPVAEPAAAAGESTLSPADLKPAWHDPKKRGDGAA